jgi:hypothetical protein
VSAAQKVCRACARRLPLEQFRRLAASRDGHRARCKRCESEAEAAARRPSPLTAFQRACGRVVERRRAEAAEAARRASDAQLLAAVDGALERAAPHTLRPSESASNAD